VRIEPARLMHINPIAINMREADRIECRALGRTPKDALRIGLRTGVHVFTAVEDDGTPVAMFGLFVVSAMTGEAVPWLLGTDRVFMHPRELLFIGRLTIEWWQSQYPHLGNIVAVQNRRAINLLRHWGAQIGREAEIHGGVEFVPFRFPAIQDGGDDA
jgi:hypothetical protein